MEDSRRTLTVLSATLRENLKSIVSGDEMKAILGAALAEMAEIEREVYGSEKETYGKWKKEHKRWIRTSSLILQELPRLLSEIRTVVTSLKEDGAFEQAPGEVQERLRNRKEGLEIICRMVERLPQRQAQLDGDFPGKPRTLHALKLPVQSFNARLDRLTDGAETTTAILEILEEIEREEERVRDQNYEVTREVRLESERLKRTVSGFLKDHFLPVLDGLERGIWDEVVLKEPLKKNKENLDVIEQWFGAYRVGCRIIEKFGRKIRLVRLKAKRGLNFNPEWHMALGTETSPDLQDDQILEILRSGWQLHGNPIRPAEVMVAKNRGGGKDDSQGQEESAEDR